ncbi:MAG: M13 family metallopeptidase [Burkholderiaceae bacterium]
MTYEPSRPPSRRAPRAAAVALLAFVVQAAPFPAGAQAPVIPATARPAPGSGIDRRGMDRQVRPQDDLYDAANGAWMRATEIPADRSSWGPVLLLRDRADRDVRAIVEGLAATHPEPGGNAQKIDDGYRSYLDVDAIDKAGPAPVAASLREVDAVADARGLIALMGRWQGVVRVPLAVDVDPDDLDPGVYAAGYRQDGLGLPDRDYYLMDDSRFAKARSAYTDYLVKLFLLSGDDDAVPHADQVVALEKKIARAQWPRDQLRDPKKAYNPRTPAELAAIAPGADWASFAAAAQLPPDATVIVRSPSYAAALAGLLRSEPLPVWRLYLKARRLDACAQVLPVGFRDAGFAFHGAAIQGLERPLPRWQSGVAAVNGMLGEAVGQLYVAKAFPPGHRARAQALVANLLKAYSASIDGLAWMSPATKAAAHQKLSKYAVKIGYPDAWRDYAAFDVRPGDALGNADRGAAFAYRREAVRVGGKVDRGEWQLTPQTVNAYYNPSMNEIVFPAAFLQPPIFDVDADDAANYGAVGAFIGHEISHGFDDRGSQFDGDGKLRDWWTQADRKAFDAVAGRLVAQYAAYQPLPGKNLNGKLTLGENIADLSGLQIAYKAWKLSLGGEPSPVIDGLGGDQRFFFGWAQTWRMKVRDERALQLLTTDPHSPGQFRADGAAINSDAFHDAFHTRPGDGMWKAPEDRIHLW